jgi:ATP-dependent Clp protease protease subunit
MHLPVKGLLMILSSFGGSTYEMRSVYDLIRSLSYPMEIHIAGMAKSAAIPLMLAADRRTASPDTAFMFHPWAWGVEANPGHSIDTLQQFPMQLEDDIRWGKRVLERRTKLTAKDIEDLELFDKARIEDAEFALRYGIIDEITERKIPAEIMSWNVAA